MSRLFISHHPHDEAIVPHIRKQLDHDVITSGGVWSPQVEDDLAACDALLAVMSPHARASDVVAYEWATALALGKPVRVLTIRTADLHPRLAAQPTVDFTSGPQWGDLERILSAGDDAPAAESDITLEGAPSMVTTAFAALESMEPEERQTGLDNLIKMDHPAALDALVLAMDNPARDVRMRAAKAVAEKGDPRSVPGLLRLIREDDYDTAWDSAWSLVRFGGEAAVPGLIDAMREDNTNTRKAAAYALAQVGMPAFEALLEARHDPNEGVRLGAFEALGQLGEPAIEPLVEDLNHPDAQIKRVAANTLLQIGGAATFPLMRVLRSDDAAYRKTAGRVLVELGDEAVEGLSRGLRANNEQISRASKVLLERIDTPTAQAAIKAWRQGG